MGLNTLSPIAPALVNILVVPAGNVKRSRFASFVSRLEEERYIHLGDITPNWGTSKSSFGTYTTEVTCLSILSRNRFISVLVIPSGKINLQYIDFRNFDSDSGIVPFRVK